MSSRSHDVSRAEGLATQSKRWTFSSDDAVSAQGMQRGVAECLEHLGATPEDTMTAQVILSELIGNIVRHAPGSVVVILEATDNRPVVHVLDRGRGFRFRPQLPVDPFAESGRGLFLVDSLASEFTVSRRKGGGTHAVAVLHPIGTARIETIAS